MFSYENGVAVAFFIWALTMVGLVIRVNSTFERNLRKLGSRTSWFFRSPKPMHITDLHFSLWWRVTKIALIVAISLPFLLLSWLYVGYVLVAIGYGFLKDQGAPAHIREYRWKMRNVNMSRKEIILATMKSLEQDLEDFDMVYEESSSDLRERGLPAT